MSSTAAGRQTRPAAPAHRRGLARGSAGPLDAASAPVELLYFWGLTASLQATLTPDLGQNFPSVYYFTYFAYHVGAIAAALLLVFGRRSTRVQARPGSCSG